MKFRWARIGYYLTSLWSLWKNADIWGKLSIVGWFLPNGGLKLIRFPKKNVGYWFGDYKDLLEIKEVVLDEEYTKESVRGTTIVDIGAGMGDMSVLLAKRMPKAFIVAFEPDWGRFELLKKNILENGVDNVRPVREFVTSLKQVEKFTRKKIDFLKIDCEGSEFEIFRKTPAAKWKKVRALAMELHLRLGDAEEVLERLRRAGFKIEIKGQRGMEELRLIFAKNDNFGMIVNRKRLVGVVVDKRNSRERA